MTFLVRSIHVGSASFLIGGGLLLILLWLMQMHGEARLPAAAHLQFMAVYEWGFWGAAGLMVATGIGNLGAFGSALPDRDSVWGSTLMVKLGAFMALLTFSVLRTSCLALIEASGTTGREAAAVSMLNRLYGATALLLLAIMALAISLAHF
jgi:hypothetical protein